MTPKTRWRHAASAFRSFMTESDSPNPTKKLKMTLCGSEVPQDRWRGRTAGSGMWTRTRDNLLSWSLDDPAIPYG